LRILWKIRKLKPRRKKTPENFENKVEHDKMILNDEFYGNKTLTTN
jgi:hypothetical protein